VKAIVTLQELQCKTGILCALVNVLQVNKRFSNSTAGMAYCWSIGGHRQFSPHTIMVREGQLWLWSLDVIEKSLWKKKMSDTYG